MQAVAQPAAQLPVAQRAGADLRAARERLGWHLPDVAASLRIRLCHLEALEDGCITRLPGKAYVVGFVRSYATALGLDAEETVRRFKAEAAEVRRQTMLVFPVPMPDRCLPAGAVMLLGLVLLIGVYVGWYRLSGEGRLPAETVISIPQRLASLAEQALPGPANQAAPVIAGAPTQAGTTTAAAQEPSPQIVVQQTGVQQTGMQQAGAQQTVVQQLGGQRTGVEQTGVPADPAPAVSPVSPTSAAAALVREPLPDQAMTPAPGPISAPAPALASPSTAVPAADTGRIMLRATADAWMLVKERNGNILLNRLMKAGDSWLVPPQDNLLLTIGNAGGITILVDDVATPSLGASGLVRRDLPLDPDQIKDGKLAGILPSQLASSRGHP